MTKNSGLTRDQAIEQYLIFRVKFEEWMLLWNLLAAINQGRIQDPGYVLHPEVELPSTLFEIVVAWFATMVDKDNRALNVFDTWRVLFPEDREEIANVEDALKPYLSIIRDLRNRSIFHAQKNPVELLKAMIAFSERKDELADPLGRFQKLAMKLAGLEDTAIPDLSEKRGHLAERLRHDLPEQYSDSIGRILGLADKKT